MLSVNEKSEKLMITLYFNKHKEKDTVDTIPSIIICVPTFTHREPQRDMMPIQTLKPKEEVAEVAELPGLWRKVR